MNKALHLLYEDFKRHKIGMLSRKYMLSKGATEEDIQEAIDKEWVVALGEYYILQFIPIPDSGIGYSKQFME